MSKLHDLITQLCPDGVPYKKLNEVLNYEQPSKYLVSSKNYSDEYSTPVLTAGKTFVLGYTNEVNGIYQASKDNPVIIFDDFTTDFKWVDFPFKAKSSGMKMLTPIDSNMCCFRYIYYAMSVIDFVPSDHKRHWISQYSNFTIPLPPLPVQLEVVRILDAFTELEAELEAELAGRKEQYEYYRDRLLDEKNLEAMDGKPVETMKLGDVAEIRSGWGFPKQYQGNSTGDYPFYKVRDMNNCDSCNQMGSSGNYVSKEVALALGCKPAPADTVIFPKIGAAIATNKKRILVCDSCYDNNVMGLIPNKNVLLPRYLLYLLIKFDLTTIALYSGAAPSIRKSSVEQIEFPVPSLATQERVVDILDRFDALTTSLTDGIPAEIAMRREQYEYYRSRLLDFPRLPEDSNSDGE